MVSPENSPSPEELAEEATKAIWEDPETRRGFAGKTRREVRDNLVSVIKGLQNMEREEFVAGLAEEAKREAQDAAREEFGMDPQEAAQQVDELFGGNE